MGLLGGGNLVGISWEFAPPWFHPARTCEQSMGIKKVITEKSSDGEYIAIVQPMGGGWALTNWLMALD